jgi:DUF4097 and DUF4098 domain-containing protein YvlB
MKTKLILVLLVAMLSMAVSAPVFAGAQRSRDRGEDRDLPERDEVHQTYELSRGARVEVKGINGTVEIETSNSNMAEVNIVRSARTREDLEYKKIIVEANGSSLVVRGEKDQDNWESRNRQVRQRVMLKIPRQVDLTTSGVNGWVTIGEVDGPVRVSGVNGRVEVGQAVGYSDISGVNGRVTMTIARLSERGIHISGVNGGIDLKFADDLNADLDVTGINGSVNADVPNVTILGKVSRQNFRAKIGSGGTPITVNGVNGSVRLARVGAAG